MRKKAIVAGMMVALLFTATAAVAAHIGNDNRPITPGISGEPPLFGTSGLLNDRALPTQLEYNYFFSPGVHDILYTGASEFTLYFEYASLSGDNKMWLYNLNDPTPFNDRAKVFVGPDTPGRKVYVEFTKQSDGLWEVKSTSGGVTRSIESWSTPEFGLLLTNPKGTNLNGNRFYGDDTLNTNNEAHMLVFEGKGEYTGGYWFAWEDLAYGNGADKDFNDMVFYAQSIRPVPEPGTMMLLGSGLVGLAGWGRKKFRK